MKPALLDTLKALHADSFGWALACCDWHRQQAEDVLQESYLRVLDGRARFSGRSTEKTWFYGVIRRVAAEIRRGQARRGFFGSRPFSRINDWLAAQGGPQIKWTNT